MNKLIHLTTNDWVKGIAQSESYDEHGLFSTATGINSFVNPFTSSTSKIGVLQAGARAVLINSAVVDQTVTAIIPRSPTEIYALGANKDIYSINTTTHAATLKVALTGSIDADSLTDGFFSNVGGTEYFYYTFDWARVGRYDPATGDYNNSYISFNAPEGSPSQIRPHHFWNGVHWIGYSNRINKISGNPLAKTDAALTLATEYAVKCLEDDYLHLVIGVSTQITSLNVGGISRIYFWDGYSPVANKEWIINEPSIQAMKRVGNAIYAICGQSLYAFDYYNAPIKVNDMASGETVQVENWNAIGVLGNALVWGGNSVHMYGQINNKVPKGYHIPFALAAIGGSNYVKALNTNAEVGEIYLSATNSKMYYIPLNSGGSSDTVLARTKLFNLKRVHLLQRMTVIFETLLASGDDITITLTNKKGQTANKQFTFAALGAIDRMSIPIALFADNVTVTLTFNGGNPRVRDVIVEGTPTTRII